MKNMKDKTELLEKEGTIVVPSKAQVKVYWDDRPENNSYEGKQRIKAYFSKKYNVPQTSINVIFRAVKEGNISQLISLSDAVVDNIMDSTYQRSLFKEWLEREKIEVEWDRIIKLDEKVNEEYKLVKDIDYRYRRWFIKSIEIDNLLSFGDDNVINYSDINGVTVVVSDPGNMGGKTTFSVDALKFLFFGETTKTDKNEEIFNTFRDSNVVRVKGLINIDGDDFVIERTIKRSLKKNQTWLVSSSVEYKKILPDGSEEDLKGEQTQDTTKKISEAIGSEKDFMTTIIATGDNLTDLIDAKPTERGKTLTKFIGLEVLDDKEEIVKKMTSEFKKTMKSNVFNTETLKNEIIDLNTNIVNLTNSNIDNNIKLDELIKTIETLNVERDSLLSKKVEIDPEILKLNPETLETEINKLKNTGITKKDEITVIEKELETLGNPDFNEDEYKNVKDSRNEVELKRRENLTEQTRLTKHIEILKKGQICPTCKRSLEDVDHSKEISDTDDKINELTKLIEVLVLEISGLDVVISQHELKKTKSETIDRKILMKDKIEVDLERMRVNLKEKMNQLKEYNKNTEFIDSNQKLDSQLNGVNSRIRMVDIDKNNLIKLIEKNINDIKRSEELIVDKNKLIETIKKENEVEKIYDTYSKMIGKNGIGKLVLRSVIPIINSEIQQMLDGVCDFELELNVNDKNEVEFLIIRNFIPKLVKSGSGYEKTLASLALRLVLGKISTLPKPNIIVLDEVLGKVADENLSLMRPFFEKIKSNFDIILLITHRELVRDWADNILMIKKDNDISSIVSI
jgi:DNA repair exonuclease SbcCD ATPase subunit